MCIGRGKRGGYSQAKRASLQIKLTPSEEKSSQKYSLIAFCRPKDFQAYTAGFFVLNGGQESRI